MLATAGRPGNPEARDPVDRESSRVQAVTCFFPPHRLPQRRPARPSQDPPHRPRLARRSPPLSIIHGDKDPLVPLQQSERIIEKRRQAGVETRLIIRPGAGHGWLTIGHDAQAFLDWFDRYLVAPNASKPVIDHHWSAYLGIISSIKLTKERRRTARDLEARGLGASARRGSWQFALGRD